MAAPPKAPKVLRYTILRRSSDRMGEEADVDPQHAPGYIAVVVYGGDLASTGSVKPWLRAQLLSRW